MLSRLYADIFNCTLSATVVQLKAIAGTLAGDDTLHDVVLDTFELLQKLLIHVVSILCSFMDLNSDAYEMANLYRKIILSLPSGSASMIDPSSTFKVHRGKMHLWKQTAIVSVMEAGGLNWLVGKVGTFFLFLSKERIFMFIHNGQACTPYVVPHHSKIPMVALVRACYLCLNLWKWM